MEDKLQQFDPTTAELLAIVETTKNITATDLKDKTKLEIVKETRIKFMRARTSIVAIGKTLREDALAYQRKVLEKENELIGIIKPEEDRLKQIEIEAKNLLIREERLEKLPARKEKINAIDGRTAWANDKMLLEMDSVQFETFYNNCMAEHLQNLQFAIKEKEEREQEKLNAEKQALKKEKAKLDAEKNKIAREKELEEVKQQAITTEKIRAEKQAQEEKELARQEAEQKAFDLAKEEKIKATKLAKTKAYTNYLLSIGWTKETETEYKTEETETGYIIYKKIGFFNN